MSQPDKAAPVTTTTAVTEMTGPKAAYERLMHHLTEDYPYIGCRDDLREVAAYWASENKHYGRDAEFKAIWEVTVGARRDVK